MVDDYPFPASSHEVVLQPPQSGVVSGFTLGDILDDKVILNLGQVEVCTCGAVVSLPATIKEMAAKLAETLPLETPVQYGVKHIFDETIDGVSQEEIVARLREWMDRHYK